MTKTLHQSRYNFFARASNGILGYNARTGHFAMLAEDISDQLSGKKTIDPIRNRHDLLELGFIHLGNELEEIRVQFVKDARLTGTTKLTILPTLQCNRNCDYCYQDGRRQNEVMSTETKDNILEWVKNRREFGDAQVTSCTWFGGEPLLAKELVFDMSRSLQTISLQEGNPLRMQIVTNGTLLDESTAKILSEVGISHAQVTFDSVFDDGFRRRGVLKDTGRPSVILDNIRMASRHLDIGIRVNVGSYNQDEVPRILHELDNNGFRGSYSLARIMNCKGLDWEQHIQGNYPNTLPDADFAILENRHIWARQEYRNRLLRRLTPRTKNCSAHTGRMLVIDPGGFINSCWHEAGVKSEVIGNINNQNNGIFREQLFQRWTNYNPFTSLECCECSVLPLCMGGCMHDRLLYGDERLFCSPLKHNIQFHVEQVAKHIEECTKILART